MSGFIFGVSAFVILESLRRSGKKSDNTEEHGEVNGKIYKFSLLVFLVSTTVLTVILTINSYLLGMNTVKADYILLYLMVTFYIALFLGPSLIKNK
ncbi:hypothetical protein CKW00_13090 [Salimicrobium humidisoli]|uniref:Group-specific protein n=1 Tax=Salimicrobium humidisoli TaxID=2029857 RepID=A0ABX4HP28_9BACI|nr:hypothetical protein CKW00_13090 [Salimicrobium humidisoli]